jgi:hypothetical protein
MGEPDGAELVAAVGALGLLAVEWFDVFLANRHHGHLLAHAGDMHLSRAWISEARSVVGLSTWRRGLHAGRPSKSRT